MYGEFPAKNTVYTPYIPINVWFWPTLHMYCTYNSSHISELTLFGRYTTFALYGVYGMAWHVSCMAWWHVTPLDASRVTKEVHNMPLRGWENNRFVSWWSTGRTDCMQVPVGQWMHRQGGWNPLSLAWATGFWLVYTRKMLASLPNRMQVRIISTHWCKWKLYQDSFCLSPALLRPINTSAQA
jgi:hypothetical protein